MNNRANLGFSLIILAVASVGVHVGGRATSC
jgi:hypothetical protein